MQTSTRACVILLLMLCPQFRSFSQIPQRIWGTYYGGGGSELIYAMAIDGAKNVYVCGQINVPPSGNVIVTPGAWRTTYGGGFEVFVAKFDSNGTRIWGTYYGGSDGDFPAALAVNPAGDVIVTGITQSDTGIASPGAFQTSRAGAMDGFIVKFDSSGHRVWATYLGGTGVDNVYGVAIDANDDVVVTGYTASTTGIATAGAYQTTLSGNTDGYLAKFTSGGAQIWGTYYGAATANESGDNVFIDNAGNIIMTGCTTAASSAIPSAGCHQSTYGGGQQDLFIAKFTTSGSRQWGTYYGGPGRDGIQSNVGCDAQGNLYISGETNSSSAIATAGAHQTTLGGGIDAFLVKFSPDGALRWGTYYGGSGDEDIRYYSITTKPGIDGVFLSGNTSSASNIASVNGYQTSLNGGVDAFLAKFDSSGARQWGTYYGGNQPDWIMGQDFDGVGGIYVAGRTMSTDVVGVGGFQSSFGGSSDGIIAKFRDMSCPSNFSMTLSGPTTFCAGDSVVLDAGPGYASYLWSPGGDTVRVKTARSSGSYIVRVRDASGCIFADTTMVTVYSAVLAHAGNDADICAGGSVTIGQAASGGTPPFTYVWNPATGLSSSTIATPVASPAATTTYIVLVTDANGCSGNDTVTVTVHPVPQPNLLVTGDTVFCMGGSVLLKSDSVPGTFYQWHRNGIPIPGGAGTTLTVTSSGRYRVVAQQNICIDSSRDVVVTVHPLPRVTVKASGDTAFCAGGSVQLVADNVTNFVYAWSWNGEPIAGATTSTYTAMQSGLYRVRVVDANGCADSSRAIRVIVHPAVLANAGSDKLRCLGGPPVTIGVTATGGTPVFTYAWSPATGLNASFVASPVASPVVTTQYIVRVTDAKGCEGFDTVLVTVGAPAAPHIEGAASQCVDAVSGFRGTRASGVQHTWIVKGGVIIAGTSTDSITVRWGSAGTGSIILIETTDSTGCTARDTLTIVIALGLAPRITPHSPVVLCSGGSRSLDAGAGYVSYRWTGNDTSVTLESSRYFSPASGGRYIVTVTGTSGCSGRDTVDVIQKPSPVPVIDLSGNRTFCRGDSALLTVRGTFAEYRWSNGAAGRSILVKDAGIYHVMVTDADSCTGISDTVAITVHEKPSAIILGPDQACRSSVATYRLKDATGLSVLWSLQGGVLLSAAQADSIQIRGDASGTMILTVEVVDTATHCRTTNTLTITVTDGLKPVIEGGFVLCEGGTVSLRVRGGPFDNYQWSTGERTPDITVSNAGRYAVQVRKGTCAGESDTITVISKPNPVPVLDPAGPVTICKGSSARLAITGAFASYRWSTGDSTRDITVSKAGIYSVTVVDANGCTGTSAPVIVTLDSIATPSISGARSLCLSSSVTTYTADSGAFTYSWSVLGGVVVSGRTARSVIIQWNTRGVGLLSLRVTNSSGCSDSIIGWPVAIADTLAPDLSVDGVDVLRDTTITRCEGSTVLLRTDAGYASYLWSDNKSGVDSITVLASSMATYWVQVADAGGCRGTSHAVTILASTRPKPVVDSLGPLTFCEGGSVTLRTSTSYRFYRWSTGDSTAAITVTKAGIYAVEVTDTNGCTGSSAGVLVSVQATVQPRIAGRASVCMSDQTYTAGPPGTSATFQWQVLGGIPLTDTRQNPLTVRWNAPGNARLIVTRNEVGCAASDTMAVLVGTSLQVGAVTLLPAGRTMLCPGDSVTLCAEDGFASYRWTPGGETSRCITVSTAATYAVTVRDASDCEGTSPPVVIGLYTVQQPRITQNAAVLTSTLASTYQWWVDGALINGATARQHTATRPGSYHVCIVDTNGCPACSDPVLVSGTASTTLTLDCAPSGERPVGSEVRVPLMLVSVTNLDPAGDGHFSAILSFRSSVLSPRFPAEFVDRNGNTVRMRIRGERQPGQQSGTLIELPFEVLWGDSACAALRIDSLVWDDARIAAGMQNAECTVCAQTCREGGVRLFRETGSVSLSQNRPNPFNARTVIEYEVIEEGEVSLAIYDSFGRRVETLLHGSVAPGRYALPYDASSLASGMYLYVLRTPSHSISRRMEVLK